MWTSFSGSTVCVCNPPVCEVRCVVHRPRSNRKELWVSKGQLWSLLITASANPQLMKSSRTTGRYQGRGLGDFATSPWKQRGRQGPEPLTCWRRTQSLVTDKCGRPQRQRLAPFLREQEVIYKNFTLLLFSIFSWRFFGVCAIICLLSCEAVCRLLAHHAWRLSIWKAFCLFVVFFCPVMAHVCSFRCLAALCSHLVFVPCQVCYYLFCVKPCGHFLALYFVILSRWDSLNVCFVHLCGVFLFVCLINVSLFKLSCLCLCVDYTLFLLCS